MEMKNKEITEKLKEAMGKGYFKVNGLASELCISTPTFRKRLEDGDWNELQIMKLKQFILIAEMFHDDHNTKF